MRRAPVALVVVALAALPRAAPAEGGPDSDAAFIRAFGERMPLVQAAIDKVIDCERRGAPCVEAAREALREAQESAHWAAGAKVSARREPTRILAEAGFRLASTSMAHLLRFHQGYEREALQRAGEQVREAGDLLLGTAGLLSNPPGEPPPALPSRERVQRDVDRHVASLRAGGYQVEDVLVTLILPDEKRRDAAVAQARGDSGAGGAWTRWRLELAYRLGAEGWVLERATPAKPR